MKVNLTKLLLICTFITLSGLLFSLPSATAEPSSSQEEEAEIWDPFEDVNRPIFWFNDKLYVYMLEPVTDVYDYVTPEPLQTGIGNAIQNLQYPFEFLSDILQAKFTQAGERTARFLINSTVGIAGIIDVAEDLGIPHHEEDLGSAFANMGFPPGPYLVLPFLGPSTLRETIGRTAEGFLDPVEYSRYFDWFTDHEENVISASATSIRVIDGTNRRKKAIEAAKESSVDYYLFVQSAYYQSRKAIEEDLSASIGPGSRSQENFQKDWDWGDDEFDE